MSNFQIEIIATLEQLHGLQTSWNQLLNKSSSNSIFLTWEWQYSWAETFLDTTRRLLVITVSHKNEIIGIAPWYINTTKSGGLPIRQISFLGYPEAASDYLDVISKNGREREVTHQLYSFLFSKGKKLWDKLAFHDIPARSLFLLHLQERITEDGKYAEFTYGCYCPATKLPTNKESFLLTLTPNRRQQYKRHSRILQKNSAIQLHSHTNPDPSSIDTFFTFYEDKTGYSSQHVKPVIENLLQNSQGQDIVQIDSLLDDDVRIASLLHLIHDRTLSMYLMVVDKMYNPKISIGNIIVGMCMENAIKAGFHTYDFLRGTEGYKFHWANTSSTLLNFTLYQKNLIGILHHSITSLKKLGKTCLR